MRSEIENGEARDEEKDQLRPQREPGDGREPGRGGRKLFGLPFQDLNGLDAKDEAEANRQENSGALADIPAPDIMAEGEGRQDQEGKGEIGKRVLAADADGVERKQPRDSARVKTPEYSEDQKKSRGKKQEKKGVGRESMVDDIIAGDGAQENRIDGQSQGNRQKTDGLSRGWTLEHLLDY